MKIGMTTTANGTKVEIIRILEDARPCGVTGLRQNLVGLYEVEPGRYASHIWLENGAYGHMVRPEMNLV